MSFAQRLVFNDISDKIVNLGDVRSHSYEELDFSILDDVLKDVEIVMLGEQSHGEGTAYQTKNELIFYLHEELGFDLLVFESGFYDCQKAWELMNSGEEVDVMLAKSIFSLWSVVTEIDPLVDHISTHIGTDNSLEIKGFDNQITGDIYRDHFIDDLSEQLKAYAPELLLTDEWLRLGANVKSLSNYDVKVLRKNDPENDLVFLASLIEMFRRVDPTEESDFWIQSLVNLTSFYSDAVFKNDGRDEQMADNLQWIKEQNPGRKIICWGATSHFLHHSDQVKMSQRWVRWLGGNYYKDHRMMGDYLKEKYGTSIYTIGFTAFEGEYGLWRRRELKKAESDSFEFLLAQCPYDNFLLPFKGLNFEGFPSRPLGNRYMDNDITQVMDAVVFNRRMDAPTFDRAFFVELYPNHKYIKAEEEDAEVGGKD